MAPDERRTGRTLRVLKAAALVVVVGFCVYALVGYRHDAQRVLAATRPRWPMLAASAGLVLAAYAVLIQVWREILAGAGERLAYAGAARIWTVSNLGRYVPGKVWQMTYMAYMARERGVSGIAAAGSALLSTLVTLVTGFAVTVLSGARVFGDARAATVAALVAVTALVAMPWLLPVGERLVRAVGARDVTFPRLTGRALLASVAGSVAAWLLLGTAFHLLALGVGVRPLALPLSIATFVGSYLLGFVAVFAPGGVGVREFSMGAALERAGMGQGEAVVLVVASRIWLTLLEIGPALVFLGLSLRRRRRAPDAAEPAE